MEEPFGRLIISLPEGIEQEYELGKASISIGRATNNDIVLNDARVSRTHIRIENGPRGSQIVDAGSSNGTRLNGVYIQKAMLSAGDTINIGNTNLRYETAPRAPELQMTMIDTEMDLMSTMEQMAISMSVNETDSPRIVVHTPSKTWEVSLADAEMLMIGRSPDNEIFIDHSGASRQHAQIIRRGDSFILRDLGSTNGTWIKDERIQEVVLEGNLVFRIGNAQLIYKSGFTTEALTIADVPSSKKPARHNVLFVPGLMGSELWLGNERVWPNVKTLFKNPELFTYPSNIPLEPRGIVDEVVIVPNLIKIEQYSRLGDYLVEDLGYERGKDLFEFGYDWRQDVRQSARMLAQMIDKWAITPPITIIAHSLGTLVTRYYVERLGGKQKVDRILLMGGPHTGTPKSLAGLIIGPEVLPFGIMGERLRKISAGFPSAYQIIPTYACGYDQDGKQINFLEDDRWLEEDWRPLLHKAREFRQELGTQSSVPTVSIFGYGLKTISRISLKRDSLGKIKEAVFATENNGDNTIPEQSAFLPGTDIHPVQQHHGTLFVDSDVKMRLKLELVGRL